MFKFCLQIFALSFFLLIFQHIIYAYHDHNGSIKLIIEDAKGKKDSVVFGLKDSSNIGIDESLGEVNIFGTPNSDLDIRVIQRDSLNFNCAFQDIRDKFPNIKMYFPENIDSKIDFRPYSFENYLQNINMYFEIKLEAKEYPVIIVADLSNFKNSKYPLTRIYLLDSNCLVKEDIFMGYFLDQDTLFVFKNNTKNTIISCFEHEFSVKDFKPIEPTWEIFPNPVNQAVTIEGLEALNGKIELIDLSGKMLNSFELNGSNSMIINIGSIPKGTYFIRCLDETKEEISIRKLIVE